MFWKVIGPAAVVGAVLGATSVSASTIDVTFQVPGAAFGSENWSQGVTVSTPNDGAFQNVQGGNLYDGSPNAGQFQLTGSGSLGDFAAFCIELAQALQDGATYTLAPNLLANTVVANVDRLFTSAYSSVTDAVSAAGFQLALWEIVHEGSGTLDLSSGDVLLSGSAEVVATANGYLSGLATASTGAYDISFLMSAEAQDVVTATLRTVPATAAPVPVPATGLLLLGGIGGLAALRRKRARG